MAGYVGSPVRRVEDRALVTGRGRFVDDVPMAGTLHVAFLRSPHAHARLLGVDLSAARAAPGVVAAVAARDLEGVGELPIATRPPGARLPRQPLLAEGRALYVGQPLAAVAAETAAQARDALERIEVGYEPLPAVTDAEHALAPGAPLVHPELGDNVCYRRVESVGDVEGAFREAAHVFELELRTNRVAPAALEPRGVLAAYDAARDELVVWASVQMPFLMRADLAAALGFPENRIRVIAPDVGGGFGGKCPLYVDEAVVAWLALRLERPVKWVSSRAEDLLTTNHGRGLTYGIQAACDAEGRWTGLRVRIRHCVGAYAHSYGLLPPLRSAQFTAGPYRLRAIATEITACFTHTSSTGPYRGTGRPEAALMTERVMDEIAVRLGLDPAEVRRRNLLRAEELPYRPPSGVTYDSGDYPRALERLLELADYAGLRREQRAARARGELLGIGLATMVGMTGTLGWEMGSVRVERSGRVTVLTGSSPHGQGHRTVWAQVAADRLGVPLEQVVVVHGDTAASPPGMGTFGARGAPVAASAVAVAAERVREKAFLLAAEALECRPDDLVAREGRIEVAGVPERSLSWAEVARLAYSGRSLPGGLEPGLEATVRFAPATEPFAYGAFLAVARVDPETGRVRLERMVAVDDCGRVLNPLVLEGQMHGALAQGIGQALLEWVAYDGSGQPLHGSLLDYALPRADDLPRFELDGMETPTPLTPLGAKGGSEAGCIGAPAAVHNAVLDALRPLGVREVQPPLTAERVWRALREAGAGVREVLAPAMGEA